MSSKLEHTARLFAVLLFLMVSAQLAFAAEAATDLGSESAHAVATPTGDAGPEAPAGGCATDPATGSPTVDFLDFDLTEDLGRQNTASCTYTCPGGLVALCPDRVDHVKSCVNECCYLTPAGGGYCETHDWCPYPLICNGSTSRCVFPV